MKTPTKEQIDRFFNKARIFEKTSLNISYFKYAVRIWETIRNNLNRARFNDSVAVVGIVVLVIKSLISLENA